MIFVSVGLSHKQAPIAIREQLAVAGDALPARLARLKALAGVHEAVLLSTCNRLEIFAAVESHAIADDLLRDLGELAAPHAVARVGEEALLHVFRVAASLDSMVVGEAQILGQLKEAAAQALALGASGPQLGRAIARALGAAKRVRTETEIARGAVSVSSIAVQLARKVLGDLEGRVALLLGAGEMAQLAARELRAQGARELLVANRSPARAEELAREVGGVPVSLAERADVALCSTGAQEPVVTRELMARALKARRFRPIFLIDLALPRNVEPKVNELENVYVYDMDDLERLAAENRVVRESQLGRAEQIVREELQAHLREQHERAAVPVLARLRQQAEAIARAEVDRTLSSLDLTERQERSVRAMASAIVNKLLHGPTQRLRSEAGEGPLGEAAARLFGVDDPSLRAPLPGAAPQASIEAQITPSPVPVPIPSPAPDPAPGPLPEPDPEPAGERQDASVLQLFEPGSSGRGRR
jgi:glutamyl-tRNA reductase